MTSRFVAAAAPLLLLLAACSTGSSRFPYSGTLQAESAAVGSTVGGRVTGVYAQDGLAVHKGEVLVRFDDRQLRAALGASVAQEAQAQAALADLVAGPRPADIDKAAAAAAQAEAAYRSASLEEPQRTAAAMQAVREAQADLSAARATAIQTSRDYQRSQILYGQGAISSQ